MIPSWSQSSRSLVRQTERDEDQKYVNISHSPEAIGTINYKEDSDYKGKSASRTNTELAEEGKLNLPLAERYNEVS